MSTLDKVSFIDLPGGVPVEPNPIRQIDTHRPSVGQAIYLYEQVSFLTMVNDIMSDILIFFCLQTYAK